MTTAVPIEIEPEGEESPLLKCSQASKFKATMVESSAAYVPRLDLPRLALCSEEYVKWSTPINIEDNQCDDLARICSKLLQEYKQAPSNNATKDDWLISIQNYVDDTTDKPQIQRIPLLREKQSNKSYDPLVVSIGPCHHVKEKEKENKELKAFEKLKTPIAQKFVCFFTDQISIEQLHKKVAKMGKSARKCYEKGSTEEYGDESFNKMMFLDGCFVLYFIIYTFLKTKDKKIKQEADPLHGWSRYLGFVWRDLFLLENQIPLPVLKVLMKLLFKSERPDWGTELIQNFLDHKAIMPPQENSCNNAVKKFIAQMMGYSVQKKEKRKLAMDAGSPPPPHLLHLVRERLIGSSPEDENDEKFEKWHSYRSVTELKSAGIHFRPSQTNHVTDVKFKSHLISSTLTLPRIVVDDSTKDLLLNLAAYEMCPHGPSDHRIMSYICLMDSFIDHADDVKELRKRRIILNNLGSDQELAKLFNEIANDLVFDPSIYANVKKRIQNHCDSKAQVWMAEWMHDHFSSPWAFLAFLGAIFVIALTTIQTYFTLFRH